MIDDKDQILRDTLRKLIGFLPLLSLFYVLWWQDQFVKEWHFMWALAFSIFLSVKWMTWWFCNVRAKFWRHLSYLFLWPGLDAKRFLSDQSITRRPTLLDWLRAVIRVFAGMLCLWVLPRYTLDFSPTLTSWIGMFGVVLVLHFGLFDLLSCFWRARGVSAEQVMNHPMWSSSLSDFWGKRWNTAFRDFANRFLFNPLSKIFTPYGALLVAFLFSGVVHDLVVSVPAQGGYGLPSLYFILQAVGMTIERTRWGKQFGLMRGWTGWTFTAAVILIPSPLLFHQPFLQRIVLPMLNDIGSF